jgi:hypothetical protein
MAASGTITAHVDLMLSVLIHLTSVLSRRSLVNA